MRTLLRFFFHLLYHPFAFAFDRPLSHADRALAWIEEVGDRDGDGYGEYARRRESGLDRIYMRKALAPEG